MNDDLSIKVGEVSGRLSALEGRMDRHEKAVWDKLDDIGNKLDGIKATLSSDSGEKAGRSGVWKVVVTVFGMAMAWISGMHMSGPR